MVERGHCHTKANCAVARKLVARTWATIISGASYELHDLNGTPLTRREATKLAAALAVPDDTRRRTRAHSAATHRARLTRQPPSTGSPASPRRRTPIDKGRLQRALTTGDNKALDRR
jgi:hypothetical protein